jgi:hypothetical protein
MSCCDEHSKPEGKRYDFGLKGNWSFLEGVLASSEIQDRRSKLCKSCENYKMGVCTLCGCIVALKISLVAVQCPLEKWGVPEEYKKAADDLRKS